MGEVQRVLDEIAHEVQRAAREVGTSWKNNQKTWKHTGRFRKTQSSVHRIRNFPAHLSDLATDGSCAMRTFLGYILKGIAVLQGLGGLITAAVSGIGQPDLNLHQLSIGLCLLATAQVFWWAGHLLHKSADRKRHAQLQHRLLKLAREKGGSLTVLEAATDARMTVEKAEEILRELTLRGHVEVRISDSGLMVYHFPEVERWDEKHWAKPIDEL